jgi:hypothetical protein
MEKARQDGVPLKVEPKYEYGSEMIALSPDLPAKKRLPFCAGVKAMKDSTRKVKRGYPLKKRVHAWLLEEPFLCFAKDACHSTMPR